MPWVESNGARIAYTDDGEPGLPVVLFAHGMFMDSRMFDRQIQALSASYRIVRWDARGHGLTTDYGQPFTYWDSAHDALAVLDALQIETAVVAGMSQGGFTALRVALTAPERVRALILIGTEAGRPSPNQVAEYRGLFSAWLDESVPLETLARSLAPGLIGGDAERDQQMWVKSWLTHDRTLIEQATNCILERDSVTSRLTDISVPTLVMRGSDDRSIDSAAVRELAYLLGTTVIEIAAAGHAVNWTHPGPTNAVILDFLRKL